MSLALAHDTHENNKDSINHTYNLNADGIPEMPDHLASFAEMLLLDDAESERKTEELAQDAYNIWKSNDFNPVKIQPRPEDPAPACYGMSPREAVIFDGEYPYEEDYSSQHEYDVAVAKADIEIAQAKEICHECPLKMICLTSSITREVRGRDHQVDPTRLNYEGFGIYGGWGPSARERIIDKMVDIWSEDSESSA